MHVLGSRLVPRASDMAAIEVELRALKDDAVAMSTFMHAMALLAAELEGEGGVGETGEKGSGGRGGLRARKGAARTIAGTGASTHAKSSARDGPRLPSLPPDTIKLIGSFVAPVRPELWLRVRVRAPARRRMRDPVQSSCVHRDDRRELFPLPPPTITTTTLTHTRL